MESESELVSDWPLNERLEEALTRALPKLPRGLRDELSALMTRETLAFMAAVLGAWVISHAFGVGELIDLVLLVAGAAAIGLAVFDGIDQLYQFALRTHGARSTADLDAAATHFANAVTILGIQAALAVLLRGSPRSYKGGLRARGPVTPVGQAYRPTLRWSKKEPGLGKLPAGSGWTNSWGDIVVSSRGSANTRQLAMLHEKLHQILTPKAYRLRQFRISNRNASYKHSSLSRFLEEALAEAYAHGRAHGVAEVLVALRFPIQHRYVYLFKRGGYSAAHGGMGVGTEVLGIAAGVVAVEGAVYEIFIGPGTAAPPEKDRIPPPGAIAQPAARSGVAR